MAIVCPRSRFAFCPWQDFDPRRLELQQPLPPGRLARRLDVAVDRLDLSAFHNAYGRTGSPAYASALLLKVVLYETRDGRHSPAPWHRSARFSEPVRWLLRGAEPSRSCWYAFWDRIAPYREDGNRPVPAQAVASGPTPAERGARDGTTIAANASALGRPPRTLLMDSAYAGGSDLAAAAAQGVTVYAPAPPATGGDRRQIPKAEFPWLADEQAYRCPRGQRLTYVGASRQKRSGPETLSLPLYRCAAEQCRDGPLRSRGTPRSEQGRTISRREHEEWSEALPRRMATAEAKEWYPLGGRTVELGNADGKTHRRLRRFSARGLNRVRCQVGVLALTQNLLTLFTAQRNDEKSTTAIPSQVAA